MNCQKYKLVYYYQGEASRSCVRLYADRQEAERFVKTLLSSVRWSIMEYRGKDKGYETAASNSELCCICKGEGFTYSR
jgi:hypothetical protein